jgi:hypothetical protein
VDSSTHDTTYVSTSGVLAYAPSAEGLGGARLACIFPSSGGPGGVTVLCTRVCLQYGTV